MTKNSRTRRAILTGTAALTAGLAGCSSGSSTPTGTDTPTPEPTSSASPTATPEPTPSEAAMEAITTARDELEVAFTNIQQARVYNDEERVYGIHFDALERFDKEATLGHVEEAVTAVRKAESELADDAPEMAYVYALLSATSAADAEAKLIPEIEATYKGIWYGLGERQMSDYTDALVELRTAIKTPERWEKPAEELHNGIKSLRSTGLPHVEGFDYDYTEAVGTLGQESPPEFKRIALSQKRYTQAVVAYLDGARAWDDEDWSTAAQEYEVAKRLYYDAYDHAYHLRESGQFHFFSTIVDTTFYQAAEKRRGCRLFAEAARARMNGNTAKADEKRKEGEEAIVYAANNWSFPNARR